MRAQDGGGKWFGSFLGRRGRAKLTVYSSRCTQTKPGKKDQKKRVSSSTKANGTTTNKTAKAPSSSAAIASDDRATELAKGHVAQTQLSKADKRAARRHELFTKQAQHQPDRTLGPAYSNSAIQALPDHALSRSALKRRKRRRTQQLAGTADTGRMEDLHAGLDEIMGDIQDPEPDQDHGKIGAQPGPTHPEAAQAAHAAAMTSKRRKAILAQESLRHKAITADLSRVTNPWAALRQHAANSLAFQKEYPSRP